MPGGTGTLSEVARRCEVATSTVSRVLNNSRQGRFSVSDEVRERILRVASELNYRPSFAARNLTANKTKLIGVLGIQGIYSDRVGPMEEAVGTLADVLDRAGYEICVSFLSQRHGPFDPPPLRVDGIVTVGADNLDQLQSLERSRVPYVSVNGLAGSRGSTVNPDDARGTKLALKHLFDLGHRKIAYLDHPTLDGQHPCIFARRQAYREAAKELGFTIPQLNLPMLPANAEWGQYYEPFVVRAIREEGATAVLAFSHQSALGVMRSAYDLGLRVPKDFSLVCFNDEPAIRLSIPSITAIDVPALRMGRMAADILLGMMSAESPAQPIHVKLDESLIVRESSAPPSPRLPAGA